MTKHYIPILECVKAQRKIKLNSAAAVAGHGIAWHTFDHRSDWIGG